MPNLFLLLLVTSVVSAQTSEQKNTSSQIAVDLSSSAAALENALAGSWVGVLEYRDFAEPATSNKRVKLPTWLTVEATGSNLRFHYVYDDGPNKTVTETSLVNIDSATSRYMVVGSDGKVTDSYAISDLKQLRSGLGTLTLTGAGVENKLPVEARTTLRIGRNLLEITRETGASGQPLTFRHAYTLVRAAPPSNQ